MLKIYIPDKKDRIDLCLNGNISSVGYNRNEVLSGVIPSSSSSSASGSSSSSTSSASSSSSSASPGPEYIELAGETHIGNVAIGLDHLTPIWVQTFELDSYSVAAYAIVRLARNTGADDTPGDIIVSIKKLDGWGLPQGEILASDSLDRTVIPKNNVLDQYKFDFGEVALHAHIVYALTIEDTAAIEVGSLSIVSSVGYITNKYEDGAAWAYWINQEEWEIVPEYPIANRYVYDLYFSIMGLQQAPPEEPTELPDFPPYRPDDYDDDLHWVPGEWVDDEYIPPHWDDAPFSLVAAGGGRYNQNLVVAGHKLVYYEEFS